MMSRRRGSGHRRRWTRRRRDTLAPRPSGRPAHHQQRPLGCLEQGPSGDVLGRSGGHRLHIGQGVRTSACSSSVLRPERHRAGAAFDRGVPGALDGSRCVPPYVDLRHPWPSGTWGGRATERFAFHQRLHLATIRIIGEPSDGGGRPWRWCARAAGDEGDARLAGQLAVGLGHDGDAATRQVIC